MNNILLIATGGTIASAASPEGLVPSVDGCGLLSCIDLNTLNCHIDTVSVMNIDSTNMTPSLMADIATAIQDNYEQFDSFIVTHGTDTLAYSAAALSCMLISLSKPVIITGSQLPIDAPGTDAVRNLSDAIHFACEDISGVFVVFNGILIDGLHASKLRSRGFDAFSSINVPACASIQNGVISYSDTFNRTSAASASSFRADTGLCTAVAVIRLFPGISDEIFDYVKSHCKGVIIEGFGTGNIPDCLAGRILELAHSGIAVVITTQCLYDGTDFSVYATGHAMCDASIISGRASTTEALTIKLMWALAHFTLPEDIRKYMESDTI